MPADCEPERAHRGGLHIGHPEPLFRLCLRWVRPQIGIISQNEGNDKHAILLERERLREGGRVGGRGL